MRRKWQYDTAEKLVAAGYRRCATTQCPLCGRNLVIYMLAAESLMFVNGEFPVFLNSETLFPHLVVNEAKTAIEHASDHLSPWERSGTPDGKTAAAGGDR